MNKLLNSIALLVAVSAVSTLAGCDLYFGNSNGGSWSYCGSDGQYQCKGNDCHWVSSTCTDPGSGSGSAGSGYGCKSNADCAAGCYCDTKTGTCTEGGFCTQNSDCGPGYTCDTTRSSCIPGCGSDTDCPQGQYCDTSTSTCTASCTCATDADAVKAGFGYCDESRMTCMPGSDPNGSCAGAVTCTTAKPSCPSGQVPTISNGCYTGNCEAISACDASPVCANINDEQDCLARTDCAAVYTGINCKKPDGTACHAGDTNCTCASFQFNSCTSKVGKARVYFDAAGNPVDFGTNAN
jgi:hypothetical protein